MWRVGIVGCGGIAVVHAEAILKMENAMICGFADPIVERAESMRHRFGVSDAGIYESAAKLIAHERPDAIHICTPHYLHVPMAISALEQGIHVFMEKPPAISREQFEALRQAADRAKARLGFCFQNRYNPDTEYLDQMIEQGTFGTLLGAKAFVTWRRDADYYARSPWKGNFREEGGSALINQAIHSLDLILMWLGEPVTASASMTNHHLPGLIETEDTCEAYLSFAHGERALIYASNAWVEDAPVQIELVFSRAMVRMERNELLIEHRPQGDVEHKSFAESKTCGKDYWGNGHIRCIEDFYRSIDEKRPFRNSIDSVKNTFLTMMKLYESAGMPGGHNEYGRS